MENNNYFLKKNCIEKIKKLNKFYENTNYKLKKEQELDLFRKLLDECLKPKCPVGYYNLYGKCLHG